MASSSRSDVQLSKTLSFILRHGAQKLDIRLNAEGFAEVDQILRLDQLRGVCSDDIRKVVDGNAKKRFHIKTANEGRLLIRANQGHTIAVENLDLKPITDPSLYATVVHGTYRKFWEQSIKTEGLKRFSRNHIHFAKGLPGDREVISGMRASCEVFIFIDLESAITDGFDFFESANGVILCPGDRFGCLPTKYFKDVVIK